MKSVESALLAHWLKREGYISGHCHTVVYVRHTEGVAMFQRHQRKNSRKPLKCEASLISLIYYTDQPCISISYLYRTVVCHGDIREGSAHEVYEIMDKALKNRRYFYSVFDDTTLSLAKSSLRSIIHQRGLLAQLTRSSPAVFDFPTAWLELTASKELCHQPLQMKANKTGGFIDEVKDNSSSFWSTVRWSALDTSRSMHHLTLTLTASQLHKMASPLHIKKKNGGPEVRIRQGSSDGNVKKRCSANAQIIAEASTILGKRRRTSII